ncbi:MAG: MoxR family ATPase [Acidobacteria bacterium]|nr:MAG: MoxR family ATPase [Acidobacteriota bacterium]
MSGSLEQVREMLQRAHQEVVKIIIGQDEAIDQALIVIATRNHALIEGVPGIAKTLLVRTLARVLDCEFGRIQFTPDLMPTDITGTNVFNLQRNEFLLVKGPIFTSFLLADEINRAPAKTQSALLQAMQERSVSIDREEHALPSNFTVFATQNPIEHEGTYPLPEAQKDRFMVKIRMEPPSRDDEVELARRMLGAEAPEESLAAGCVQRVLLSAELKLVREALQTVTVREQMLSYIVDVVRASRRHESVMVGAGPRATQALLQASRAYAVLQGRDFITPDDVRAMVRPVMGHRLILRPEYEIEGVSIEEVIDRLVQGIEVPK